jgi:hypothetical protein
VKHCEYTGRAILDDEAIKRKLLEEAQIDRQKSFGIVELAIYLNDYLLNRIRTMTLNDMWDYYRRNLPVKAKVKVKGKRKQQQVKQQQPAKQH